MNKFTLRTPPTSRPEYLAGASTVDALTLVVYALPTLEQSFSYNTLKFIWQLLAGIIDAGIHRVCMSLLKQPVCSYGAYPSYILLAILCHECYNVVKVRLHMFLLG